MNRRTFIKNTAYTGISFLAGCHLKKRSEKPNILIILADDMGFSDIGGYGSEIMTPNLDSLAETGLRFSQFYNSARCSPSRAALLTGLHPHQTGVGHLATSRFENPSYQGHLNKQCVTIAEILRENGYKALMTGKWHIGTEKNSWPTTRGFHRFYGEHSYVDSYFYPTNQLYLDDQPVSARGENWYSTDSYTDYALKFLDEETRDNSFPWFLYLAFNAPHFPLQAFQEDIHKYGNYYSAGWDKVREDRYRNLIRLGIIEKSWDLPPRNPGANGWQPPVNKWEDIEEKNIWSLKMAAYAAQIDRMDQNIGRLITFLKERDDFDNTIIIFLSDNGGCAEDWINQRNPEGVLPGERDCMLSYGLPWAQVSNTPFRLFKRWVHEGGIATPCIIHWTAGLQKTGITNEMSHVVDIMPTLLEVVGAEYPSIFAGKTIQEVEGKSLLPLIENKSRKGHDSIGWEHEGNRAFRSGEYKIVWRERFQNGPWELYNIQEDRTEMHDLSVSHPEIVNDLENRYKEWARRTGVISWDKLTK